MKKIQNIFIAGAGAWGTALALVAARAGRNVTLWSKNPNIVKDINSGRTNPNYLPDLILDAPIQATVDMDAISDTDAILLVTPAQTTRQICKLISSHLKNEIPIIICAKGLDQPSGRFLSEIMLEELPKGIPSVLSGPSFASDVARGLPTAVTLASPDLETSIALTTALASNSFRPYASDDIIGAQVGGSLKNVLAIACGIVKGHGLGASAHAAIVARGFAELYRIGEKIGANAETLTGLSGLGDLVLTCSSEQSRNFSFGYGIGRGVEVNELMDSGQKLVEGYHTARVVLKLARKNDVELPICKSVSSILNDGMSVEQAMASLLSRPLRME